MLIEHGAHHVDLMFSNEVSRKSAQTQSSQASLHGAERLDLDACAAQEDPQSFKQARSTERRHIKKWVAQVAQRNKKRAEGRKHALSPQRTTALRSWLRRHVEA